MKKITTLLALALICASVVLAADKAKTDSKDAPAKDVAKLKVGGCCDKAEKAGKKCAHACCVEAAKEGKVCEKCNPPAKG